MFEASLSLHLHSVMTFQKRGLTFISDSSFILSLMALEFGVCRCYFPNKKLAKFWKK